MAKRRTWRVTQTVRVVIDPDAWAHTYGIPTSEVREDVKRYIETVVADQLALLGVL
jgi:hypothetical protein